MDENNKMSEKKADIPQFVQNCITVSVDSSSIRSVEVYYDFLPQSYEFAKEHYQFIIYECDKSTYNLKPEKAWKFSLSKNNEFVSTSDVITLRTTDDKGELELENGNLYALGLNIAKEKNKEGASCELANITYFCLDEDDEYKGEVPEAEYTYLELRGNGSGAIQVKYNMPEHSPKSNPRTNEDRIKIFEERQSLLFTTSVPSFDEEVIKNNNSGGKQAYVVMNKTYESLESGNVYTVVYCYKEEEATNSTSNTCIHDDGTGTGGTKKINYFAASLQFTNMH